MLARKHSRQKALQGPTTQEFLDELSKQSLDHWSEHGRQAAPSNVLQQTVVIIMFLSSASCSSGPTTTRSRVAGLADSNP